MTSDKQTPPWNAKCDRRKVVGVFMDRRDEFVPLSSDPRRATDLLSPKPHGPYEGMTTAGVLGDTYDIQPRTTPLTQAEVDGLILGGQLDAGAALSQANGVGVGIGKRYEPADRSTTYERGTEKARRAIAEEQAAAERLARGSWMNRQDAAIPDPLPAILAALQETNTRLAKLEQAIQDATAPKEPWDSRSVP